MRPLTLVPWPKRAQNHPGTFELTDEVGIEAGPGTQGVARLLRAQLSPAMGFQLRSGDTKRRIRLGLDASSERLGGEGYRLNVEPDGLRVTAARVAGLLNGAQTLRQLLPVDIYRSAAVRGTRWEVPCAEVEDVPRYSWRGALLDVARHFAPQPFLLRFVDLLAMHKMNVLHLHLTDDQGWRFPSELYPRLNEVGSWRRQSTLGHSRDQRRAQGERYDGTPHGGFYTQTQLRDLVNYANERNVTVVPEIDFPGHTQAAIAAYPELGNLSQALEVGCDWGISNHVLNLEASTVQFCRDILSEVAAIFQSPFIHVGGDECPRVEWQTSLSAAARIRRGDAPGVDGLQSWFTNQLNDHLNAEGRRLVGWDEILEGGGVPEGAVVMSWRGEGGGVFAARAGLEVVMCPEHPCYFYHYQSSDPGEPLAAGEIVTLEDVHAYEPRPSLLGDGSSGHVLGAQFQLWSEYMPTTADVEYMAFPRGCAFSEVVWSSDRPDFAQFRARLADHLQRLEVLGVNFRPLDGPRPWQVGGTGPRGRVEVPPWEPSRDPVSRRQLGPSGPLGRDASASPGGCGARP